MLLSMALKITSVAFLRVSPAARLPFRTDRHRHHLKMLFYFLYLKPSGDPPRIPTVERVSDLPFCVSICTFVLASASVFELVY
jgi:hypothetical protein